MLSIPVNEVCKTISVSFYGSDLYVVNHNGEPYVPMKPIVEGMGLAWGAQFFKLKQRFSKGVSEIEIPTKTGNQDMVCLALRKLAGWLATISPNKVKASIRDKVIQYQDECDDVLYEYWTIGEVKAKQTTTQDRTPLRGLVNTIMGKYGLNSKKLFQMVHDEFGVNHIDELTHDQLPSAIEYLATKVIEGEFLGREELPKPNIDLSSELRNVNALHKNLMHLKDAWDRLNPHLSVLTPDIAHAFNGAFSNVSGPVLILRNGIERKASLLN
ncbi:phage antirepressor N-terminal domain-containing protein [Xenorhabdus bovienii]|uniref:phage antirepressor N-terminal domain-containing protein n=1 Tax=Xenorhabdus bovienii TaxID=40576 RepID=UPI00237D2B1C|nr:phage antirepressor N-terminal domain-containing protein [Xenorhabdus bovienii]MDE1481470.1 phage antirepressor N-terminal domain-containing protein [Xenorhabdus bovienii]MDE9440788.1 phage antirepressor N-terminal domain-containing protein [Xenorhabdus bovienii]